MCLTISNQVPPQIDDNLLDEIILSFAYVVMYVWWAHLYLSGPCKHLL